MKLTEQDKVCLLSIGNRLQDLNQIEYAVAKTTFKCDGEHISQAEALTILGRKDFLCGMSRSAFHWDTSRTTPDGRTVDFDSSRYFGHYYYD